MSGNLWAALASAVLVLAPVQLTGGVTEGPVDSDVPSTAVQVSPSQVAFRPGPYSLYVSGWGFNAYQVGILLDGTPVGDLLYTEEDNTFSGYVSLDQLPDCGEHEIGAYATDEGGVDFQDDAVAGPVVPPPADASTDFVVTCPELTLSPGAVDRASLPTPLTWTVTGFTPETPVALRLDGQPAEVVVVDAEGSATTVLPADGLPCGTVTAEAREVFVPPGLGIVAPPAPPAEQPSATASLLVRCLPPPEPDPEPEPATLVTNPTIVAAGATTLALGQGFTPAGTVALSWMLPDGSVTAPVATVTTGPDGAFSTPALVLTHSLLGPRELVAGEAAGGQAAAAPVLVVPGSSQPGRHGLVNRR